MVKANIIKLLHNLSKIVFLSGFVSSVFAGGFQLWEQNITNLGNFHAGRAVLAPDASIAFDNPAGIPRIPNQQVVAGAIGLLTNVKYSGDVSTCMSSNCTITARGNAQGGGFSSLPVFHYVAPITSNLGFGVSIVSPYGSDVEYGRNTIISNIITRARMQVIDIAPSLGINVNKKLSLGLGLDIEKMSAEFDFIVNGLASINKGYDTAYGYHLGALYEFTTNTRIGLAYHSKVSHHLKGTSNLIDAALFLPGLTNPTRDKANIYLPSDTTLSLYQQLNPQWAVMGSIVYVQWNIMRNLILQHISALNGIPLDYPMNFHNAWALSLGTDYKVSDKAILRAGLGYDQTPVCSAYRILAFPDNDRYGVSIGGHYQVMKPLGLDVGWTRVFVKNASLNPPLLPLLIQQSANGTSRSSADIVGVQLTWDFV